MKSSKKTTKNRSKVVAIILAAGASTRFSKDEDKLLVLMSEKPLICRAIDAFQNHKLVDEIILVCNKSNKNPITKIVKSENLIKVKKFILGGASRQDSVLNGFNAIKSSSTDDVILIHNGANPFVSAKEISATISAIKKYSAAGVGHKVVDTIQQIENGFYQKNIDRKNLIAMQTPQGAKYFLLKKAFQQAKKTDNGALSNFTDESSLLQDIGVKMRYVPASENNFKITTKADLTSSVYVGIGQDSHAFPHSLSPVRSNLSPGTNTSLKHSKTGQFLGGAFIKSCPKLSADSDGDVILHSLCNALLQATGGSSFGQIATKLFKENKIKDSKIYLQKVLQQIQKQNFEVNNLGLMIECKIPKIDPIASEVKKSLSVLIGLPLSKIGITATSGDGLTSFGKGLGIQCLAIVSLIKNV